MCTTLFPAGPGLFGFPSAQPELLRQYAGTRSLRRMFLNPATRKPRKILTNQVVQTEIQDHVYCDWKSVAGDADIAARAPQASFLLVMLVAMVPVGNEIQSFP
eukprot:9330454-Pyramimonas_sp.AAC.1